MKTLATYNIKGGVGKTASAVNLAYLAAQGGLRTLLWDLDPQGAASYLLRIRRKVPPACTLADTPSTTRRSTLASPRRRSATRSEPILPEAASTLRDVDRPERCHHEINARQGGGKRAGDGGRGRVWRHADALPA